MRWMFVHFFHSVEIPSLQAQANVRSENENYTALSVPSVDLYIAIMKETTWRLQKNNGHPEKG